MGTVSVLQKGTEKMADYRMEDRFGTGRIRVLYDIYKTSEHEISWIRRWSAIHSTAKLCNFHVNITVYQGARRTLLDTASNDMSQHCDTNPAQSNVISFQLFMALADQFYLYHYACHHSHNRPFPCTLGRYGPENRQLIMAAHLEI